MLHNELMLIVYRDREREIEEAMRVRSLLDGRQPETRRPSRRQGSYLGGTGVPQPLLARPR